MPQNVYDLEITDMIKISEKKYINIEFKKVKGLKYHFYIT